MSWCVSPAGTCPLPGSSQFFLPCLWGMGNGSSSLTFTPAQKPLLPLFPYRRQRKGKVGGQGSPSVLRLHRVFRLNQENFYYQKEKKEKKKKLPAATFPPCPIGTVKTGSVGFLGGWLRAGTLSGKSGGVPWQALRQAHFGLLPSPHFFPLQATHQRWPSPPPGPWATGLYTGAGWGYCTALARAGGGTLVPSIPCPLLTFPRAGHFLP